MHLFPILEALAETHDVTLCVDEVTNSARLRMGYVFKSSSRVRVRSGLDRQQVERGVLDGHPDTVHIANLSRNNQCSSVVRELRRKCSFRLGIISEYLKFGMNPYMRIPYVAYAWAQARRHRRSLDFILAMGDLGCRQFRTFGFPPASVFPFGYTVEQTRGKRENSLVDPRVRFNIVYCGSLSRWKSVDTLIRALGEVDNNEWQLHVIGDGRERSSLKRLADSLQIAENCDWHGFLDNEQARNAIALADLLVLPSRHEGWGAVVNEAIMAGTPVVISSRCGAEVLARAGRNGEVFTAGSVKKLSSILNRRIAAGSPSQELRAEIKNWSGRIAPVSFSDYLVAVVNHIYCGGEVPDPVWQ